MIHDFLDFVQSKDLFSKEDNLLLALSGGADSVSLFHMLRESGYSFSVAHVNYSLRGEESDLDREFVKSLCEKHGIECFIKDVPESHWEKGMNIQAEARDIRYAFFNELAEENDFSKILSAHHKADNIETILMNISRGTGISGLKGMETISGNLVRPLLFAERKNIEAYLEDNKYDWRNDSSNSSSKYKRNRFRNEIIPLFENENPSFSDAIDRMIENVELVEGVFLEAFKTFCSNSVKKVGAKVYIDKSDILNLNRFLFEYLKDFGFNRDQVKDMLLTLPNVGKHFESGSHVLFVDRSDLVIVLKEDEVDESLEIVENASALLNPIILKFYTKDELNKNAGQVLGQFDKAKLKFPLKLRVWKEGDRIHPLGMKGTKKISDVLTDKKVSIASRKSTMVLLSDNEIVWLVGYVLSEKVKVEESTKEIWCAELR